MPGGINILGFSIKKSPKDPNNQAYTIPITVLAGTTRVINFPSEFNGVCDSVTIQNTDAANQAVITINGDSINAFNAIQGSPVALGEQWIIQIRIVAGAAAPTILLCEIVPIKEVS